MRILLTSALILFGSTVFAKSFYDLNLSDARKLKSMTFSLNGLCANEACKGVKLTVPFRSRVTLETMGQAKCGLSRSLASEFLGGMTYILEATMTENSKQSCNMHIYTSTGETFTIKFVNLKLGL